MALLVCLNPPPLAQWPTVLYLNVCHYCDRCELHSQSGGPLAVMAIRDDDIAAESIGINPTKWKLAAFVLGTAHGRSHWLTPCELLANDCSRRFWHHEFDVLC